MGGYGALLLGATGTSARSAATRRRSGSAGPTARPAHSTTPRTTRATTSSTTRRTTPRRSGSTSARSDPFHNAAVHYAHEIHAQLHVWPGGHDSGYWHSHMRAVPCVLCPALRLTRRSSCTSTSRGRCGRTRCARSRSGTTTRCPTTSSRSTGSATSPTSSRSGSSRRTRSRRTRTSARSSSTTRRRPRRTAPSTSRAIFSPAERVARGVDWDEIFSGYCDGAQEARELHGVEVRLTPDIPRGFTQEEARADGRATSAQYRDRGVVGVGLGGLEAEFPPEPYDAGVRARASRSGLGSVPHAGEVAGAGLGARRARGARRRPAPARDPRGRGSRPRRRARRPRHRPRRLPALEPPHRRRRARSRSTRCRSSSPPASAARSRPTTRRCSTPT